jgi:hypothetical protein
MLPPNRPESVVRIDDSPAGYAADHGLERHLEPLQKIGRLLEKRDVLRSIDGPAAWEFGGPLQVAERPRFEGRTHDRAAASGPVAIGPDLREPDDERIVRHHAFDIEGTGLRVSSA